MRMADDCCILTLPSMERRAISDKERKDRRRTKRIFMPIPVVVTNSAGDRGSFEEETHTLRVNEAGGLITLRAPIKPNQQLVITNTMTRGTQTCRVAFVGPKKDQRSEVGIEFVSTAPGFWEIPQEEDRRRDDRRTTRRIFVPVRLVVQGTGADGKAFREDTHTVRVNDKGALITLEAYVKMGQKLSITKGATGEEQEVGVVFIGPRKEGKSPKAEVGIRFLRSVPGYWNQPVDVEGTGSHRTRRQT